jgi:hypothetical protein
MAEWFADIVWWKVAAGVSLFVLFFGGLDLIKLVFWSFVWVLTRIRYYGMLAYYHARYGKLKKPLVGAALVAPIWWALDHLPTAWDAFTEWAASTADAVIDWVTTISVNLTIISAITLSWLIVALSTKFSAQELVAAWKQRKLHPPTDEEPLLDLGPEDLVDDLVLMYREFRERLRKEAAEEEDDTLQQHAFELIDDSERKEREYLAMKHETN